MSARDAVTTYRHDSALGLWSIALRRPHPALRHHVTQFWHGAGRVAYQRDRILPCAQSYLLINLGAPQYMILPGPPELRVPFDDLWFSGLYEGPIECEAPHGSVLLGVAFSATGAASLLPWSQSELANRTGPLEDLIGIAARRLRERLLDLADIGARLDLVEDWLLETCMTGRSIHPLVHWATRRIAETGGQVRAEALAREAGCSRKHLTGVFSAQVGLPPKAIARIHRFQRAVGDLSAGRAWADLAADCGYYDQSHLIRDFQQFARMSPAQFAQQARPDATSVVVR